MRSTLDLSDALEEPLLFLLKAPPNALALRRHGLPLGVVALLGEGGQLLGFLGVEPGAGTASRVAAQLAAHRSLGAGRRLRHEEMRFQQRLNRVPDVTVLHHHLVACAPLGSSLALGSAQGRLAFRRHLGYAAGALGRSCGKRGRNHQWQNHHHCCLVGGAIPYTGEETPVRCSARDKHNLVQAKRRRGTFVLLCPGHGEHHGLDFPDRLLHAGGRSRWRGRRRTQTGAPAAPARLASEHGRLEIELEF
mmetsp:Transcript_38076/g.76924  ORF Transcript_38076/g.76924 Transcript_38076/m.76924 type:complete len:249 (+) Transcript_38076:651-1397(+)